jgi:hypothetical protein
MVQQFADALGIDRDWLYYLAGRFPEDVRNKKLSEKQVAEAMVAFRGGRHRRQSSQCRQEGGSDRRGCTYQSRKTVYLCNRRRKTKMRTFSST